MEEGGSDRKAVVRASLERQQTVVGAVANPTVLVHFFAGVVVMIKVNTTNIHTRTRKCIQGARKRILLCSC